MEELDHPSRYAKNRILVEAKMEKYFKVFKYSEYTKELIIDLMSKTYETSQKWNGSKAYQ